jgi:hypothetical protein
VWHTPEWADDGSGAMPIGNGDATAMVWVDSATGDLRLVLGKSDAFDENSKPVKTGVLRLAFDPPLWKTRPSPHPPVPPGPRCAGLSDFNQTNSSEVSTIGDQHHMLRAVQGWKGTKAAAAELCCNHTGCVAFSIDAAWGLELFSTTATDVAGMPGGHWQTWLSNRGHSVPPLPPPPPPAPAWGDSSCVHGGVFCQTLDIATSTVTIVTPSGMVNVSIDLNPPLSDGAPDQRGAILRVHAGGAGAAAKVGLTVTLEQYRLEQPEPFAGPYYQRHCYPRFEHEDTVDTSGADAITWHHWNHLNTTYWADTMRGQGVDPSAHPELVDPFTHRAFGAQVLGMGLHAVTGTAGLQLATTAPQTAIDLEVRLLTLADSTPAEWTAAIVKLRPAPAAAASSPVDCTRGGTAAWGSRAACGTTWEEIMGRNYIQVESISGDKARRGSVRSAATNITTHAAWDRYLSIIQGRSSFAPIKFNGQSFLSNQSGKGFDYRQWGTGYWWQGTRHPYYNALAAGDIDTMRSMLDFYTRMLPYAAARCAAQWKDTAVGGSLSGGAVLYEEVTTLFGTYQEANWGCNTTEPSAPRTDGASNNRFIRFHFTGSLELSLMALDLFDATQNKDDLTAYLPMVAAVVEGFRQRFPGRDTDGKVDFWPSQALETYGCHNFTGGSATHGQGSPTRETCVTNPSTDIAGLMAVLPRLITLPTDATTVAQRAGWQLFLGELPPLPVTNAGQCFLPNCAAWNGTQYNTRKLAPVSQPALGSAQLAAQKQNSENTELYSVQPFRLIGTGKDAANLSLARQTYFERATHCNIGWCQDLLQAASLGLVNESQALLAERAAIGPVISGCASADQKGCTQTGALHSSFRFRGFTPDGEAGGNQPNNNQLSGMRTGLNRMLLAPLDDAKKSVLLFPAWPVAQWNVRFKLNAPLNTTIEASCQAGKLEYLIVTPRGRATDVKVMNCKR